MCLSMILGSSMETLLEFGPAGTGIQACTSQGQASRGAWALESVSLAGSAGDGDTGDTIGTTGSCLTTTATYLTAEFSPIAASITAADFTVEEREDLREASMDSHRMAKPGRTPAPSVALIMEEPPIAFPRAGSRASVEVSTEAEASKAGGVTAGEGRGNSVQIPKRNG